MSMTVSRYGVAMSQPKTYFQQGATAGVILKYGIGALHLISLSGVLDNSVVTLYDGTTADGTVLWASGTMGKNTQPYSIDLGGTGPTPFTAGLFLTITAANSNVFYKIRIIN